MVPDNLQDRPSLFNQNPLIQFLRIKNNSAPIPRSSTHPEHSQLSPLTYPPYRSHPHFPPFTIPNPPAPPGVPLTSNTSTTTTPTPPQYHDTIDDLRNMVNMLSQSVQELKNNLHQTKSENTRLLQTISELQHPQQHSSSHTIHTPQQTPDLISFTEPVPTNPLLPPPPVPPVPPDPSPSFNHSISSFSNPTTLPSVYSTIPSTIPQIPTNSSFTFSTPPHNTIPTNLPSFSNQFPSSTNIFHDHDILMREFLKFQERQTTIQEKQIEELTKTRLSKAPTNSKFPTLSDKNSNPTQFREWYNKVLSIHSIQRRME